MAELKNILVTGGCGFIGSNFVHYVYKKYPDYRIYVLDALTYAGNLENLEDIEKHKFAHVFHFAAESHVDRSFFNFSNFVRTNVEGALLLALMIKRFGGEMVHVSTDEVYGSIPEALGFVKEDAPFFPANPYASSKAAADMLLQTMMKTSTVPVKIVRGTNNFGPYQYPEKLIPLAITNLLEEKKMPLHGSGAHLRQWIHVDDMCSGIDLVAHKGEKNGIYNIAGEHESNIVVLKKVAEILGKDINQYLERVPDRPNADMRYAIDASKLEALGWKRTHTFVEELPRVVQWYADNKEWWQKLKRKKEFAMHYELQAKAKYF